MLTDYLPVDPTAKQVEPGLIHGEEKVTQIAPLEHDPNAYPRLNGVLAPVHTFWTN